jgi:hypothetical protein
MYDLLQLVPSYPCQSRSATPNQPRLSQTAGMRGSDIMSTSRHKPPD